MPDAEWQELQERLKTAKTSQEKAAAADAMRQYIQRKGKGSKPTMVTLRRGGGKDNAIPLEELADRMIANPEVYDRIAKIVVK